ncbi:MAG: DinB family protein [Bryobacterales bacterium]|nr:DinB family protein [Bryobacterales bacterium]
MASAANVSSPDKVPVLTAEVLLAHWQGHRRLTRRMIEAFPEDKLFSFSVGGMRPFSELAMEFVKMAAPIACGVATGKWTSFGEAASPKTKAALLALWDQSTEEINAVWPTIPAHRFAEVDKAFGQWENSGINTILYAIDNETHHRGQGYVYLRALGIEPPAFYDRS